jgi:hypothetical protein
MIRGTTPTVIYVFPFEVDNIEKFRMYFIQGKETILTKTEEDCTFDGTEVSVTLTEEETYQFSSKKRLESQARYLLSNGKVFGTKPKIIDVYETGEEAILVPAEEPVVEP